MTRRVGVQLLVGRNEEPFLPYAIRSVLWADYFCVVNTGPSSPAGRENERVVSEEIPKEKLRYERLPPDANEHFSFADARNVALGLADLEDAVLIVDSDDVHYPIWEQYVRDSLNNEYDSITTYFYHLMVYKDIYQYVQPREIVYTNYEGTHWQKGVHELLINSKKNPTIVPYHYMHYGYVKPQADVFRRWKFYSDLEGDYHHYDGQNPDTIIQDRVSVCKPVPIDHPDVIQEFLKLYPNAPREDLRYSPPRTGRVGKNKVGLVLLTVNDEELIDKCLSTLNTTEQPPDFTVLAMDCNSTDNSLAMLQEWQGGTNFEMEIVGADSYTSLTESLNYGFDYFRADEEYEYVGWIHPDMEFIQATWLHNLWTELQEDPKIGKICAANFRDVLPDEIHRGHEQCYIMRKDIIHKIGLFDERFIGIGGYEDWDLNKRIMDHQGPKGFYEVMITPRAWCYHHGMATRSRRDTRPEQIANAKYYYDKWGTYNAPV